MKIKKRIRALSLFANVGIAETYLKEIGIDVLIANEIDPQRVKFYNHLYPKTKIITGDITNPKISDEIIELSKKNNIDLIMATPPCQGMSTAGKKLKDDERNYLIKYAIDIIEKVKPKFVFLENVPEQLQTHITYNGERILIPKYLKERLDKDYEFNDNHIINAANYSVPQQRERAIFLLVRKDINIKWDFPKQDKKIITLEEAFKNVPSLDPEIYDVTYDEQIKLFPDFEKKKQEALKISKYHKPPIHAKKHVIAMMHTPSGETAFNNDKYYPRKDNGERVNGHYNTYRRFDWDKPARTITQNNGVISSLCCVHPGKYIGKDSEGYDLYSDARCLTLYELFIIFSLPKDWNVPDWADDRMIRQVIGEGIPPMLVRNLVEELMYNIKSEE